MTRSQLVAHIAPLLEMSREDAASAVDTIFNSIAESLETGRRVELRGFGSFGLKERRERTGRNPKTGEVVAVEAKRVMYFKAGKELRERVDRGTTGI